MVDEALETAVNGTLEIFASNYQYSVDAKEQIRVDMCVMRFLNDVTKDPAEQERYFERYKEMRD